MARKTESKQSVKGSAARTPARAAAARSSSSSSTSATAKVSNGKQKVSTDALRRFVRTKGVDYLDDPNVTSVGIALKDGVECIQFTVAKKVPETQLEALGTELIPPTIEIDGQRIPTDVVERSYRTSYEIVRPEVKDARKQRVDPLVPGVSVSHFKGTAGTLGAIVYDRQTGAPCVLSNWHVLHTPVGALGDVMVQPGPYDDNRVSENYGVPLLSVDT